VVVSREQQPAEEEDWSTTGLDLCGGRAVDGGGGEPSGWR